MASIEDEKSGYEMRKRQFWIVKIQEKLFIFGASKLSSWLKKKDFDLLLGVRFLMDKKLIEHSPIDSSTLLKDWGIVFHGKIYDSECLKFLSQSLVDLREIHPKLHICVSTYDDSFLRELTPLLKELSVEKVVCHDVGKLPSPFGSSLCQQINSAYTGILWAHKKKLSKVAKIRLDQRLSEPFAMNFIHMISEKFVSANGRMRVIGSSYNSYLERPLGVSDMIMFGTTSEMLSYWEKITVDEFFVFTEELQTLYKNFVWNDFTVPEVWLAARYARAKGIDLSDPYEANYRFWNEYAMIVDSMSLGQIWFKTHPWFETNYFSIPWLSPVFRKTYREIHFNDWLCLYQGIRSKIPVQLGPY